MEHRVPNASYRIKIEGRAEGFGPAIKAELVAQLGDFSLEIGKQVELILPGDDQVTGSDILSEVVVFFGGNIDCVDILPHIPILTVASSSDHFSAEIPKKLNHINAIFIDNKNYVCILVTAILESLEIIHRRRRVFLSYRRSESTDIALYLYNQLSAAQFNVFIDTHEIRPGRNFQDSLWHELSDSDVMIMLDTPSYFESRWTREEFGRANFKHAAIFRIAWPGLVRAKGLEVTQSHMLEETSFVNGALDRATTSSIINETERLRSKSIAVRQANLLGSLRSAAESLGGSVAAAGHMRRVEVKLPRAKPLSVFPAIGVPNSEIINRVTDLAGEQGVGLLFDHVGVLNSWQSHLDWLGERVDRFIWIKAAYAESSLSDYIRESQ